MRDLDIRRALRSEMERWHREELDTLVLDELGLCEGAVRVDLAVVNGILHGYEIKSERDTLARLQGQAVAYSRSLDRVTIVVGPRHLDRVAAQVPLWWGLMLAEWTLAGIALYEARAPSDNPGVDPYAQAQLLWRDEVLDVLATRELDAGVRSKPRRELWRRLANELLPHEVGEAVRERLKSREGWRVGARQT
jgi:hypothetical protein